MPRQFSGSAPSKNSVQKIDGARMTLTCPHCDKIKQAVAAQADDNSLWQEERVYEAYLNQSLRWLHSVIETGDENALASILEQSKEHK